MQLWPVDQPGHVYLPRQCCMVTHPCSRGKLIILLLLCHAFEAQTLQGQSIKDSKDADFSLVFFSYKNVSWGWGPGPDELGQKRPKTTPIMTSSTKTSNQNFPTFKFETARISASLESSNNSLAQSAGELWQNKPCQNLQKFWQSRGLQGF